MRDRILDAAVRAIDDAGESSVRVVRVCEEAGVTQGMVRYYFGDRAGLVAEAKGVRFAQRFGEMLDVFVNASAGCRSERDLRAVIDAFLPRVFSPERSGRRLERNIDIGGAVDQELLARQIAASRDAVCRELADVFASMRAKGLIRKDADVLGASAFYLAFVHGFSMWELGDSTIERELILETFKTALFGFLFD